MTCRRFIKDIQAFENVQKRAAKLVKQLKDLSYEDRLKKLNLTTLEERRTRGDLIQFFKFHSNINTINWHQEPATACHLSTKRELLHVQSCLTLEFSAARNNSIKKCESN